MPQRMVEIAKSGRQIFSSEFFVLRTPLLPFDEILQWGGGLEARRLWKAGSDPRSIESAWQRDVDLLRHRLQVVLERPEIAHALFMASPALQIGIGHWEKDPNSKKGIQAERALVRYFERMSARSTPFGLFSGCSVGQVPNEEKETALTLQSRCKYRVCSRLDFEYLFALTTSLRRDPVLAPELPYWPNSSLQQVADGWHYVESRLAGTRRTHHLVKIASEEFLNVVLARAQHGAKLPALVESIVKQAADADISEEEARDFLNELIENEVLVSSLCPLVTGESSLDDLIAQIIALPSQNGIANTLIWVRDSMAALDRRGLGVPKEEYGAIAARLEALPAKVDRACLYQVDMIKPADKAVLTAPVIDELVRGVQVLCKLGQTTEPEILRSFREAFLARYDRARVPLLQALDEEAGVGFGQSKADGSPLIRGLQLGGAGSGSATAPPNSHAFVLRKLVECAKEGKAELDMQLEDLPSGEGSLESLPNSFTVMATLIATSMEAVNAGDFQIYVKGGVGPDGARFFGRFCHAEPGLEQHVRKYLRQEEEPEAEAIYAEIVYLPEGRIGNVLCRPVLREYELVYLGRSGAPMDRQIPVTDLLVSVDGNSIVLHSQRLGRRIIPRLTNAHGFTNPQLASVYRFLCYLQHQHGISVPGFSWGPLEALEYLPRLRVGRIVLSSARWRLNKEEIAKATKHEKSARFIAVQEMRDRLSLPRWVMLEEFDNALTVDLDNALSVDAFVHLLKRVPQATLREMYPTPDQLCVTGPEGRFTHELNVPFVQRASAKTSEAVVSDTAEGVSKAFVATPVSPEIRTHAPGSDWLYVKLYGGVASLDELLAKTVNPLVRAAYDSRAISRWFFVRYADPQPHLRIRFNGPAEFLRERVIPLVASTCNPLLASGNIWKIQFDTYEREIERYGGADATLATEDIFCADSDAVLEVLQALKDHESLDHRWRVALLGVDALLTDLGLDLEAKRKATEILRISNFQQFQVGVSVKKQLGDRFRGERHKLDALFDSASEESSVFEFARNAFERRTARIGKAVARLRNLNADMSSLADSYVHMHVNRLIRSSARQHEIVLYDFLFRVYDGRLARGRKTSALEAPSF